MWLEMRLLSGILSSRVIRSSFVSHSQRSVDKQILAGQLSCRTSCAEGRVLAESWLVWRACGYILNGLLFAGGEGACLVPSQKGYQAALLQSPNAVGDGLYLWPWPDSRYCRLVVRNLSPLFSAHRIFTSSGKCLKCFGFQTDIDRLGEVKKMADRIIAMRARLYDLLVELKTPGEWGHIKSQIGAPPYLARRNG